MLCDPVECADAKGAEFTAAYEAAVAAKCEETCTETCGEFYKALRAYHDNCDEDALTREMEEYIHDLEEPCEDYNCWVKSSHCPATDDWDRDNMEILKEAAFDRCSFTVEDARKCPTPAPAPAAEEEEKESSAVAAALLAVFLW